MGEDMRKWENLSSDCLVCIFCNLGLEELTLALPFVCKSWYEASLDSRCWKNLDFRKLNFFTSGSNFDLRFRQDYSFSSLMKLCVSRSRGLAVELTIPYLHQRDSIIEDLAFAATACPKLKVLEFPGVLQKNEKQLSKLISKWKELEILKIRWKPRSISEIIEQIGQNCPNFIGLHLCAGIFNSKETRAIVRCMLGLKILVISGSIIRKEDLMEILDGCKELEVVNVSNCAGFDVDNEILNKASKINKFECEGTTKGGSLTHHMLLESLKIEARYGRFMNSEDASQSHIL